LRGFEQRLEKLDCDFNPQTFEADSVEFCTYVQNYFRPRMHLYVLLNQMVMRQEGRRANVVLDTWNTSSIKFVEIGIKHYGLVEFKQEVGSKINLLLTLWGSQIKSSNLLFASTAAAG